MAKFMIQVQAQFEVEADTFEDACDAAVDQAMEMEPTEWGTVQLPPDFLIPAYPAI